LPRGNQIHRSAAGQGHCSDPDHWVDDSGNPVADVTDDDTSTDGGAGGGGSSGDPGGSAPRSGLAPQRESLKDLAKREAVSQNDLSATYYGLGALAGLIFMPGGVVIVIGAAFFQWLGGRYQELANDPPRPDFDQVTLFQSFPVSPVPGADGQPAWQAFLRDGAFIAVGLRCLTTSLERLDGAEAALATAPSDALRAAQQRQIDAVRKNATAIADLLDGLPAQRDAVNAAWAAILPPAPLEPPPTAADLQRGFAAVWTSAQPWIAQDLQLDDAESAAIADALSAMAPAASSAPPAVLLDDAWSSRMGQLAAALRALSGGISVTWSSS
jgi:hypothetical protein